MDLDMKLELGMERPEVAQPTKTEKVKCVAVGEHS